jgi:nucleotide-binding universal stress UspA family protein
MIRKMLVADDGSKGGEKAFAYALALAKRLGIGLQMVCVEEAPRFPASIDEVTEALSDGAGLFDKVVAAATAQAAAQDVVFQSHVVVGHPVAAIVEFIQRGGYDLLVVGFMGHSALYNRVIGSTTDRLVEHAPCQVLVVK